MGPLTKKEEKLITSLQQKKYRKQERLFVVEGEKMVNEAMESDFDIVLLVSSIGFASNNIVVKECDSKTMRRISTLTSAPGILAVVRMPELKEVKSSDITLLIDKVQDPGNLGTIIRTADAMGVKSIVCSNDTVDIFSPKVVQATMGSIFRVNFRVTELSGFLKSKEARVPVYAAHLNGKNLYQEKLETPCFLMVGNESKGINDALMELVSNPVKIPMHGPAESFNVSIATAIILAEFRRQL